MASRPVLSDRRFAARPVGAQGAMMTVLTSRIFSSELTSVVLPTPGPPVITSTFEASATRMASFWLSASASLVRCSTQGIALSASIWGQGGLPTARARSLSAISRSARYRPARKMHCRLGSHLTLRWREPDSNHQSRVTKSRFQDLISSMRDTCCKHAFAKGKNTDDQAVCFGEERVTSITAP